MFDLPLALLIALAASAQEPAPVSFFDPGVARQAGRMEALYGK
jgi:hypothetical protein